MPGSGSIADQRSARRKRVAKKTKKRGKLTGANVEMNLAIDAARTGAINFDIRKKAVLRGVNRTLKKNAATKKKLGTGKRKKK